MIVILCPVTISAPLTLRVGTMVGAASSAFLVASSLLVRGASGVLAEC